MQKLLKNEWTTFVSALAVSAVTGIMISTHANAVLTFVISAVALAMLANLVGHATEQLGNYMGPGATGVLHAVHTRQAPSHRRTLFSRRAMAPQSAGAAGGLQVAAAAPVVAVRRMCTLANREAVCAGRSVWSR